MNIQFKFLAFLKNSELALIVVILFPTCDANNNVIMGELLDAVNNTETAKNEEIINKDENDIVGELDDKLNLNKNDKTSDVVKKKNKKKRRRSLQHQKQMLTHLTLWISIFAASNHGPMKWKIQINQLTNNLARESTH